MGTIQTSQSQQNFYKSLKPLQIIDGSKSLMVDPETGQQYAVAEHTFPSQQQIQIFLQELRKKGQASHQYYMNPFKQIVISSNSLCSKQHKVVQIFRYEDHSLYDEIKNRKAEGRCFEDKQVWSVLCSCVLAMSHLTKNQIIHLPLNPKDILLTPSGQVKILAKQLSQFQFDYNYQSSFYYPPEILKCIINKNLYTPSNKAPVFTLGLTMLSVMNLQDLSFLYKNNSSIDFTELNKLIEKVQNADMRNVITKMLKSAPYERISFPQLEEMLYNILEKSELLQQSDVESEQQIEKLQESIYRLKTKQDENTKCLQNLIQDVEDVPDTCTYDFQMDTQILDEDDLTMKQHSTVENSNVSLNKQQTNGYKFSQPNLKVLADRSNSVDISESLKIVDDNKKFNFSGFTKTSRVQGPSYVTEQYSRGRYEGYKQNGMRHGFGTFYYEEGGKYSGEWVKNKMQGRGALYYNNGELAYEGEWSQDQLHGYGILYNQTPQYISHPIDWRCLQKVGCNWVKYEGNFSKDLKSGEGKLYLSNGQWFRGDFLNDMPNGKGFYRLLSGQIKQGEWKNGVFY